MRLIVGLGNPGRSYDGTRHNVGFAAVDALARAGSFADYEPKFLGLWTQGELAGGGAVALLKPQTFMNLSGESVRRASSFLQLPPRDVIVVHDELDLPWGEVRLKIGGGHAGHHGVRSVLGSLGSADFARVRVGIGKPPAGMRGKGADWVLSPFDAVERAELPAVVLRAVALVEEAASRAFVN